MKHLTSPTLSLAAFLAIAMASGASAQFFDTADKPDAEELVSVDLVSERAALTPGAESMIGLTFEIHPDWHLYWKNSGDTGMAPIVQFDVPEGVAVGEIQWPAPRRYVHSRGLLDYIYESRVTLLVPVNLSSEVAGAERISIGVDIEYLVCKEVCLAGEASLERTFEVAAADAPPPLTDAAPHFEQTRKRLPRPPGVEMDVPVITEWDETTLRIRSPGASGLTFFPLSPPEAVDLVERGVSEGDSLSIEYKRDALEDVETVAAVIEAETPGGPAIYSVSVRPPRIGNR